MTLKELKEIIMGKRIDRVASFCNSYEQMFDRCSIDVHNGSIVIDTSDDGDNSDQFELVPKVIDQLLAMPSEYDDYPILKSGYDNNNDNGLLVRQVICVRFEHSHSGGTGLKLLGRESLRFIDDVDDDEFLYYESVYHVEIVIEDPKAKKLNEKFCEFLHANCNWFIPNDDPQNDNWDIYIGKDVTFLDFITDEGTSANLIALITRAFDGAYFTRTLLSKDAEVERLSNDRHGKYFGPCQAVVYPAYIPDDNAPHLTVIATAACYAKECASKDEMEQFIASLNPDEAVGDLVRRVTTRYIDPLTLILE